MSARSQPGVCPKARLILAVVMFAVTLSASAQSSQEQRKQDPDGASSKEHPPSPEACGSKSQLDILTDTRGVDFGPYLRPVIQTIRQNWYNIVPAIARPPELKEGTAVIQFAIKKDGSVVAMKLYIGSGDVSLDRAAWGAIVASKPFPALPTEFSGNELGLRFYFQYNPRFQIVPAGPIDVSAGSSQQFSTRVSQKAESSLHWSLSGNICDHADCGKISDDGMYTAPSKISMPMYVIVNARQKVAPFEAACATVHVVPQSE